MTKRLAIVALILSVWVLLACSLSQLGLERQASVTSTPTRTPKPTFTPTNTPTRTLTPSPTPTPSNTPTNTPIPTNTPLPTDTPMPTLTPTDTATPFPTNTPTSTPRPTRRPTARPTQTSRPQPTKPPALPFNGVIVRGYAHCGGYSGVTGHVRHANGSPQHRVSVGVWSDTWSGRVGISGEDGKYDIPLNDLPPGQFKVAVVKLETCSLQNAAGCVRVSNVIQVATTANCIGDGANQVTEVDFTGP